MYTVAPGTQTGTRVRLRGKGVPSLRNKDVRGDHYVTLVVQVPTKLTSEQKEAIRRLDEVMNGDGASGTEKKPEKKGMKKVKEFFDNLVDDDK